MQGMENSVQQSLDLAQGSAQQAVNMVVALVSTWGLKVIGAIAVLIIGRWVAGAFRSKVRGSIEKSKVDSTLAPFFSSAVYYLIITVVVIAVLNLFGVETTSLIAVLGAAGLAVGLAMQGTLSNFAAGVMLLVFRPFRPGDYVNAGGNAGTVVEIGIFTTIMNTIDNVQVIVPNSAVFGQTIMNYSANPLRRNDLVIGVSYGDDLGKALEVIQKTLNADSRVLEDPQAVVAVSELGDSSVNFVVRPWCKKEDYWPLRFDLTRQIKENLEAAGCSIPFPQRDVHIIGSEASAA
jgi:small conductance mechanosensitive channel